MNKSTDGKTPGQRIDAVLAPFLEDETRLQGRIDKLNSRLEEVKHEIVQAEQDLSVVRSAKVDALRDAVEKDPMLAELFTDGEGGDEEEAEPEPERHAEPDRHRLLAQQ